MDIRSGIIHLKKSDKLLASIINQYPEPSIKKTTNFFQSLTKYIIYQQLSTKSAKAIYSRFIQLFKPIKIKPNHILSTSKDDLKLIGLSKQKINYINNVANFFIGKDNEFQFEIYSNQEIYKQLIAIKGIGPWTIDMFMMFTLCKPDILPIGDLGIKKAFKKIYNLKKLPSESFMKKKSLEWKPFRTIACCYLWKTVDDYDDVW